MKIVLEIGVSFLAVLFFNQFSSFQFYFRDLNSPLMNGYYRNKDSGLLSNTLLALSKEARARGHRERGERKRSPTSNQAFNISEEFKIGIRIGTTIYRE